MDTNSVEPTVVVPDTPDFVGQITDMFRNQNHPNPEAWAGYHAAMHSSATNPKATVDAKQRLINRQLRLVLGEAQRVTGVDTTNQQFTLLEDPNSIKEWLDLISRMVVPCLVKLEFPK